MKVLITYNTTTNLDPEDFLCHAGVLDEVRDVKQALVELGFNVSTLSVGDNIKEELTLIASLDVDLIFNLCESIRGRSALQPCFAGFLELLDIPFTGSPSSGITVAIDKRLTKARLAQCDIPTPPAFAISDPAELREKPLDMFPYIVKPACEDGSIGIREGSVVQDEAALFREVANVTGRYKGGALVERYIDGREFNIGFLGNENPDDLAVVEICFANMPSGHGNFLSYKAKWDESSPEARGWHRECPAEISLQLRNEIVSLGRAAYKAVGLRGYGRIDLRLDHAGHLYVLEVNANPDLTRTASFPCGAEAIGLSYTELIQRIVNIALGSGTASPQI